MHGIQYPYITLLGFCDEKSDESALDMTHEENIISVQQSGEPLFFLPYMYNYIYSISKFVNLVNTN